MLNIITEISGKLSGPFNWQQKNLTIYIVDASYVQIGQTNIERIRFTIFVNTGRKIIKNNYFKNQKMYHAYSTLLMVKSDGPYALISLAVIRRPFDVELSDTSKSPRFSGSILGKSISGMPRAKDGRKNSVLLFTHCANCGSFLRHTCI